MGRKGSWFCALKRALSSESKKKDKAAVKSKWFGKEKRADKGSINGGSSFGDHIPTMPPSEQAKLMEAENEQNKHAYSVAIATAAAAEAAVAAAQAAAEVVRLTASACNLGKSNEEIAAIKIQTAFRGYMSRRALRALKGLVRLKTILHGQSVKRQAASTLKCMQTLARLQSEVRARRIRTLEEEQALQKQLKEEKVAEKLRAIPYSENWDVSTQSKEQIEANLLNKLEAAKRRERALAYAFTHQTLRNSQKSNNQTIMDPNNPNWGWSWLERWMAERKSAIGNELTDGCNGVCVSSKPKRVRPRGSYTEEDWRSMASAQSERCRRHSIAGSSVRDDESFTSSPAVPGYMTPTESARARSRLPSPLSSEKNCAASMKGKIGSVNKRLSFASSSGKHLNVNS